VGLIAVVGSVIAVSVAAFQIGLGAGKELASRPLPSEFDWSILTPVRDWVLLGEAACWAGTALGIWALVQGIVAVVKHGGRGAGVGAIVCAAIGPIAFAIAANVFLSMGFAAGAGVGG